jgi:hypothetical protein
VAQIPPGNTMILTQLRQEWAHRHAVEHTCPMSTAIFLNLAARAHAGREEETGKPGVPCWRVLRGGWPQRLRKPPRRWPRRGPAG